MLAILLFVPGNKTYIYMYICFILSHLSNVHTKLRTKTILQCLHCRNQKTFQNGLQNARLPFQSTINSCWNTDPQAQAGYKAKTALPIVL